MFQVPEIWSYLSQLPKQECKGQGRWERSDQRQRKDKRKEQSGKKGKWMSSVTVRKPTELTNGTVSRWWVVVERPWLQAAQVWNETSPFLRFLQHLTTISLHLFLNPVGWWCYGNHGTKAHAPSNSAPSCSKQRRWRTQMHWHWLRGPSKSAPWNRKKKVCLTNARSQFFTFGWIRMFSRESRKSVLPALPLD